MFEVLAVLILVGESVTETVSQIVTDFKKNWKVLVASVLLSILSFGTSVNLFGLANITLNFGGPFWVDQVIASAITGFALARGSGLLNSVLDLIKGKLNAATPEVK
jgi:F0F1-type ATP synthase membrane subunit a